MTPEKALSLLFSSAVMAEHPDTASRVIPSMAELLEARNTLRQLVTPGAVDIPCGTCRGKGTVAARFGRNLCGTCKGTGDSK